MRGTGGGGRVGCRREVGDAELPGGEAEGNCEPALARVVDQAPERQRPRDGVHASGETPPLQPPAPRNMYPPQH
eukprot:1191024-Prorocentrum_minimum.AAC.1